MAARAVPAAFVDSSGNYAPLEVAVTGRRTFVAIGNPVLFAKVDDYMCGHGLYDKGNVTILDEGDGVRFGEFSETVVFVTDDLEFARGIKRGASR